MASVTPTHLLLITLGCFAVTACGSGGDTGTSSSTSSGSGGAAPISNSQITIDGTTTKLDDGAMSLGTVLNTTELFVSAQSLAMPTTSAALTVQFTNAPAPGMAMCTDATPSSVPCTSDMSCPAMYPVCNFMSVCETATTYLLVTVGSASANGTLTSACTVDVTEIDTRVKGSASGTLTDNSMFVFDFDVPRSQ